MSDEATSIEAEERRQAWLRRLVDEFLKLEPLMPLQELVPQENAPQWVVNVEREIGVALFPLAQLKDDLNLTPSRVGAMLGHTCALAVWMMENLEHDLEQVGDKVDLSAFTPEQIERGVKILEGTSEVWYPALRRLAKRALCSCVDQSYSDMTAFLRAYTAAFSRKPRRPGLADIGNATMEVYLFLDVYWRGVNSLRSVHELHQVLVRAYGPHRVGELKRIEKICQRIGLRYRKRGRPAKSEVIQTPKP